MDTRKQGARHHHSFNSSAIFLVITPTFAGGKSGFLMDLLFPLPSLYIPCIYDSKLMVSRTREGGMKLTWRLGPSESVKRILEQTHDSVCVFPKDFWP